MKFVFTGGGSGGHFYPLMAVAERLTAKLNENNVDATLYYMAPESYDDDELETQGMVYLAVPAGKMRRYFSLANLIDPFKTIGGIIYALVRLFLIYPDVVFAKGGYGSFPVLVAARMLFIPVVIHESDTVPGRTNKWAGKFAERIAVSYAQAAEFFDEKKVAHTGQPIRPRLLSPKRSEDGKAHFDITEEHVPVILVLGGSQGAKLLNDIVLQTLPQLVERYYVIHQTGPEHHSTITHTVRSFYNDTQHIERYIPRKHLDSEEMRAAAGAASLVLSRAGSTIFEIAAWSVPSIIIPITDSNGDHQRKNAYAYARSGAASVIEESNFKSTILESEIDRIMDDEELRTSMREATSAFVYEEAADTIANELYHIAAQHYT